MTVQKVRCHQCVLPESPLFKLDAQGTCDLCRAARQQGGGAPSGDLLEEQISRVRERGWGRPYDCVVGLSGGRDSSYLLYLLTQKHRLRFLAGYYRTPFTPAATDANVRRITQYLNVPLVELNLSAERHRLVARELTTLWTRVPRPVVAHMACAPCKLVNRELFKLATDHHVRTIINGGNK